MEREGRREGRGREGEVGRRGGGEMRRRTGRGIIVGGMILGLLLGCNNGIAELEKEKESILSISNLRQGFLNVFATFGGMVSDALGIDANTTKKQVGSHFSGLGQKVQEVLEKIKQITTKEGDSKELQGDILSGAVNKASEVLTNLKTNLDLLAKIGDGETGKVGEVGSGQNGVAATADELKNAHQALKGIVNAATSAGIKEVPQKRNVELTATGVSSSENGAKVLTAGATGSAVGDKASLIVSTVSGNEMLAEIVQSKDTDADTGIPSNADATTSALAFAKGHTAHANIGRSGIKLGPVSAAIALRSLVKGSRLASHTDGSDEKAVQLAGADAASKLVVAVETLIIKTVNKALEGVKQAITTTKSSSLNSKEK